MISFVRLLLLFLFLPAALPCFAQQKYVPLQAGSGPGSSAPPSCITTYQTIKPVLATVGGAE